MHMPKISAVAAQYLGWSIQLILVINLSQFAIKCKVIFLYMYELLHIQDNMYSYS